MVERRRTLHFESYRVTHLNITLQLLRVPPNPAAAAAAANATGGSLDLKGGVGRDFPLEELLQPQYAQRAVFKNERKREAKQAGFMYRLVELVR